ncbi:hypothetical protein ACIRLA_22195 [Streptomyces sp. NPDC102364]|uniref:hypothetical protein n=1 Tax=Streptomyces sp. NPDC102364 TaxID=3366161 RepID=UPI00381435A7
MTTDPIRPTRAEIAEQVRVVRAAQDDVDALLAAAPSAPADQNLRDRIAQAALHVVEAALGDTLTPSARGEALAGIAAVLPAPADEAPPLLAEVWTVWCEDESAWGYFATEDAGKTGTIDYYQEQEERCPDYGWRQDGARLELLAGGETTGIYLSRHLVCGKPAPADRAAVLREAADAVALDRDSFNPGGGKGAYRRAMTRTESLLRRMADEAQQAGEQLAYPPVLRWRIELYDPLAEEWNPGSSLGKREDIVDRFEAITSRSPKWKDGTPVQRRIVREATTYTIEEPDRG